MTARLSFAADPVGLREIASRLGIPRKTLSTWRYRGQFPEPRWVVSGLDAWDWSDIEAFCAEHGIDP